MKRRDLLAALPGGSTTESPEYPDDPTVSQFANRVLPKVQRTTAGLEPYTGAWGSDQLLHLLRRTTFGAAKADVDALRGKNVAQAVDILLTIPPDEPSQPLSYDSRDTAVTLGSTWINAVTQDPASTFNPSGARTNSLKAWWVSLMLNQQLSIREKMVLFWHNHFVTAAATVGEPRFSYRYLALLRKHALGNFKDLARQVSFDGAMLRYLNGNTNTKTSPNENYARELQELFTIGKGPEVAQGDYTNYTEADVKTAAKVLTGWKDFRNADTTIGLTTWTFDATRHDVTNKAFSARYGGTVIVGGVDGDRELNELIAMIFAQPETATFLCRKLYRWFVYYVIDDWTETNIIAPLAETLRNNNYNVLPLLSQLLKSAHFYDAVNAGCVIKSPLDHVLGVCRQFAIQFPAGDVVKQYAMWNYLWNQAATTQMSIGDPPDVSGWHAYYQEPQYYELWINSDTLPKRSAWTDRMMNSGYTTSSTTIIIDPIAFVKTLSDPTDPNVIINEATQVLFPLPPTASQKTFLKGVLLPGLPDYEWQAEWGAYIADPTNTTKLNAVKGKLKALLAFMMEMPEFQLM